MTQEEKQLLLVDLCARLPYGVKCLDSGHGDSVITNIDIEDNTVYCFDFDEYVPIEHIKPYLRPMSSMTEEEKIEFESVSNCNIYGNDFDNQYGASCSYIDLESICRTMDWLNAHHFDYRGLIEKGLALEAPEDMYKLSKHNSLHNQINSYLCHAYIQYDIRET